METEPTVFVVDDDAGVRKGLSFLIESVGLKVETYDGAQEFLEAYHPSRPGCLVLDVRMQGMSGLDLQDRLAAQGSTLPVIIITGHGDVPMAVRAMKEGAVDFIEKPFREQALLDRIHQALGEDARRRQERGVRNGVMARLAVLTPREREVLDRVVAGKQNKVIAAELGLSTKTVEFHRSKIMEKLEVANVAELVRLAIAGRDGEWGMKNEG